MSYWYSLILRTLEGSADEWMEMVDYLYYYPTPTDDDFWEVADSLLNLVDFTDYMIAETWMGNLDWPWNNIKIYRDRGETINGSMGSSIWNGAWVTVGVTNQQI